jgi:cysteine desulfuration protein SufE
MLELEEIAETFELLGDWEERYAYLIELGEQLPQMQESAQVEENRVKACMSKVWVCAGPDPDHPGRILFQGECDTAVIKGVVALLVNLLSGRTREKISHFDVDRFFEQLQLAEHLSPNRHVGIYAIVELMKTQAAAVEHAGDGCGSGTCSGREQKLMRSA